MDQIKGPSDVIQISNSLNNHSDIKQFNYTKQIMKEKNLTSLLN